MSQLEYTIQKILDLLDKAEEKGIDLEKGCELENLTLAQLDALVNYVN